MKTTKYIFSIGLIALTTISLGQRSYVLEQFFPEEGPRPYFANERDIEKSRIEIWTHNLHNRISKKTTWDLYENPVVAHSFTVERVDVVYEEELAVEKWMTTPFETGLGEEELYIESWMTQPFYDLVAEEELNVESWMTIPFEVDERMEKDVTGRGRQAGPIARSGR